MLQRVDVNFANYVLSNWLPITRKWSIHAQTGLVHFGNTTNNRLESANRHLKRHTNPCDALVTAVRKVSDYSRNQLVDGAMKASHGSDRRLLVTAECAVQGVLHRMMTYTAAQIVKRLKNKHTDLHHVHVNPSKVIKVLVKFLYQALVYEYHKTFILDFDSGTCNCRFYQAMWLPCDHIISVFCHISVTGGNSVSMSSIFQVPLHDR